MQSWYYLCEESKQLVRKMCKDYKLSKVKDYTKECAGRHHWVSFGCRRRQKKSMVGIGHLKCRKLVE